MTASSGTARLDGARMFSRLMIWVCLTTSVTITATVIALAAFLVIFETSNVIPCKNGGVTRPWVEAKFSCSTTVNTTVTTNTKGRPPTTRTTSVTSEGAEARRLSPEDLAMPLRMTPPLLLAAALWQAAGFFRQLFRGHAFSAQTVRRLRNFSVLGVLFLILNPAMPAVVKAVFLPFHIEPAAFTWGPIFILGWKANFSDLLNIVFAATLIAMVSVLARAAKIAEDHAQIV
jgi:hypothetical protein